MITRRVHSIDPADEPRHHGVGQKSFRVRHFDAVITTGGAEAERRKLRVTLDVDTSSASYSRLHVDLFDGNKWNTIVTAHPAEIDFDVKSVYRTDLRGLEQSPQYLKKELEIQRALARVEEELLEVAKVVLS